MNVGEVAALRLACAYVEDHRLAALADVVAGDGTLAAAIDAVRTRTYFGGRSDAGEVHATSAGLRVRVGDGSQPELAVTWAAVAGVLMPALRGDLAVEVVAAYDECTRADSGRSGDARVWAWRRWREVRARVLDAAFSVVPVQPALFVPSSETVRTGGRRSFDPGR